MSRRAMQILWGMLVFGLLLRLALAFETYGHAYDINSLLIVREFLGEHGLAFYGLVNEVQPVMRWPYPPGYLPGIYGADWVAGWSGLPFHGLIQVPAIAADLALAWLVQLYLGDRGAAERMRLAGAGLVLLGPIFILISGHHGQIDSLAILPAVGALVVWQRGGPRRGAAAGALIGVGAALKIVPGLMLLALLPSARSWREAAVLTGVAVALPVATLAPFVIADPGGVATIAEYKGGPGQGGLTLALQPELARFWLGGEFPALNPAVEVLFERGVVLNVIVLAALSALLWRFRPDAARAAVLLWMTLWVAGTTFFFHYLIWGLPFLVMAGFLRAAAAIQLAALGPALLFYLAPWDAGVAYPYAATMLLLWAGMVVGLVLLIRSIATDATARGGVV